MFCFSYYQKEVYNLFYFAFQVLALHFLGSWVMRNQLERSRLACGGTHLLWCPCSRCLPFFGDSKSVIVPADQREPEIHLICLYNTAIVGPGNLCACWRFIKLEFKLIDPTIQVQRSRWWWWYLPPHSHNRVL